MSVRVTVSVDRDRILAALRDPSGPAAQFVERRCQTAENFSKAACPVNKGRLRRSIRHEVRAERTQIVGSVYSDVPYAKFVHEGTGIYGPKRAFIYPKRGQYLVFQSSGVFGPVRKSGRRKGRGDLVFARRVRGIPPSPFLVQGLEAAMPGVPIRYHR
jgi:hypothetical protein